MKTLITQKQIKRKLTEMATTISDDYRTEPTTIIGIMTGSLVLLADLIRLLDMPLRVGMIQARSYEGTGACSLSINTDYMPEIKGRDVIIVDDIFDTGQTLHKVVRRLKDDRYAPPKSLRSAVLLRKEKQREVNYQPDYVGFDIPNEFVVGYGLDYNHLYRNLSCITTLEAHDINSNMACD